MSEKKKLEVKCPECKTKFNYYDSEFRPFCSEKCKMVDLGLWLTESYTVPEVKSPEGHALPEDFDEFAIDESDMYSGIIDDEE